MFQHHNTERVRGVARNSVIRTDFAKGKVRPHLSNSTDFRNVGSDAVQTFQDRIVCRPRGTPTFPATAKIRHTIGRVADIPRLQFTFSGLTGQVTVIATLALPSVGNHRRTENRFGVGFTCGSEPYRFGYVFGTGTPLVP